MSEKPLIHLIDDEDAVRRSASFLLKTSGYEVRAYPSGVAFLKEARHPDPGCILLDIRMPEMDGLEVQRELNARGIALPVIVLTGHGDVATAVTAMKPGALDFLETPFEQALLLAAPARRSPPLGPAETAAAPGPAAGAEEEGKGVRRE